MAQLSKTKQETTKKKQSIKNITKLKGLFKITKTKVFYIALVIAIIHIFILSISLITENKGINAFGATTVLAVPMNQDLDNELYARIIVIETLDISNLAIGDKVIIFGQYGKDIYWVNEVVKIDLELAKADTTFDGFISNQINIEDIKGLYVRQGHLIHRINHVATTTTGFASIIVTYALIFVVTYYLYIKKPNEPSAK